jgi:hypothetical protein
LDRLKVAIESQTSAERDLLGQKLTAVKTLAADIDQYKLAMLGEAEQRDILYGRLAETSDVSERIALVDKLKTLEISLGGERTRSAQEAVSLYKRVSKTVSDSVTALRLDKTLSALTTTAQFELAERTTRALYEKAIGGDSVAAEEFSASRDRTLGIGREMFGSGFGYDRVFSNMVTMSETLATATGKLSENAEDEHKSEDQTAARLNNLSSLIGDQTAVQAEIAALDSELVNSAHYGNDLLVDLRDKTVSYMSVMATEFQKNSGIDMTSVVSALWDRMQSVPGAISSVVAPMQQTPVPAQRATRAEIVAITDKLQRGTSREAVIAELTSKHISAQDVASALGASVDEVVNFAGRSFAAGNWNVEKNMLAKIHSGETVLPADSAEKFRKFENTAPLLERILDAILAVGRGQVEQMRVISGLAEKGQREALIARSLGM